MNMISVDCMYMVVLITSEFFFPFWCKFCTKWNWRSSYISADLLLLSSVTVLE